MHIRRLLSAPKDALLWLMTDLVAIFECVFLLIVNSSGQGSQHIATVLRFAVAARRLLYALS